VSGEPRIHGMLFIYVLCLEIFGTHELTEKDREQAAGYCVQLVIATKVFVSLAK